MYKLPTLERFMGLVGLAALLFVSLLWIPAPVTGQGPEDRPTIAPPTATPGPLSGESVSSGAPPSLRGTVINWGFRDEPNIPVRLSGADWYLDAVSDAAGRYVFERLGNDVILLNVLPPEGSSAKSLTTDLAVRPAIGEETVVNPGLYEGDEPLPLPVNHTMEVSPSQAQPGDRVTFINHLKNNLDIPITHAQLTDYLPAGLGFVSAESDHGPVNHADNLVVAHLGTLDAGDEATVTIVALVDPDSSESWELTNRSSLLYRESVATQAQTTITIFGGQADELPVTGFGLPLTALGLGAIMVALRRLRTHAARS